MAAGYTIYEKDKAEKELAALREENEKRAEEYEAALKREQEKEANGSLDKSYWEQIWGMLEENNKQTENLKNKNYSSVDLSKYSGGFSPSASLNALKTKADAADRAVDNYSPFSYEKEAELNKALEDIRGRKGFSYDVNADALYKQYEDTYLNKGKLAMQDAMGQAQAATGGYGNSYAATVGNQAYQSHVQGLSDIIPQLEQNAYNKYNQKGEDLYRQYALLADDKATAYGKYLDEYGKLVADRDYHSSEYNNEYNRAYGEWSDQRAFDYNKYWDETNFGYQKDLSSLESMNGLLGEIMGSSGSSSSSSGSSSGGNKGDVTGSVEEDRSEILDKIAKTLSGDDFRYDARGAQDYINGLLYNGTISTDEAKYLWNMSGVGAITGEKYEAPSASSVAVQRFLKNAGGVNPYDEFRRGTADLSRVEKEIKRQYSSGLINEDEVESLFDYYGIIG